MSSLLCVSAWQMKLRNPFHFPAGLMQSARLPIGEQGCSESHVCNDSTGSSGGVPPDCWLGLIHDVGLGHILFIYCHIPSDCFR